MLGYWNDFRWLEWGTWRAYRLRGPYAPLCPHCETPCEGERMRREGNAYARGWDGPVLFLRFTSCEACGSDVLRWEFRAGQTPERATIFTRGPLASMTLTEALAALPRGLPAALPGIYKPPAKPTRRPRVAPSSGCKRGLDTRRRL